MMRRAIIESPFKGTSPEDRAENIKYGLMACKHAADLGFVPFASHLFFPQFLNEDVPEERQLGIEMGYDFWEKSDVILFYVDRGISSGMEKALAKAFMEGKPVRKIALKEIQNATGGHRPLPSPEDYAPKNASERPVPVDLDQLAKKIMQK